MKREDMAREDMRNHAFRAASSRVNTSRARKFTTLRHEEQHLNRATSYLRNGLRSGCTCAACDHNTNGWKDWRKRQPETEGRFQK